MSDGWAGPALRPRPVHRHANLDPTSIVASATAGAGRPSDQLCTTVGFGLARAGALDTGRYNRTVVPKPTWLSSSTEPPDCATKPWTMDRPSPRPLPASAVVKKGSKACSFTNGVIPAPVSVTLSAIRNPGAVAPPSPRENESSIAAFTVPIAIRQ